MARNWSGALIANYIDPGSNHAALQLAGDWSFSAWVNLAGTGQIYFQDDGAVSFTSAINIGIGGANVLSSSRQDGVSGTVTVSGLVSITNGVWTHVGAVHKSAGPTTTLYVSGAVDNGAQSQPNPVYFAGTKNTIIGAYRDAHGFTASPYQGSMAELCLWGAALSDLEMAGLARGERAFRVRAKSIVGYWPLDGLQSPEPDLSGNAFNGTINGTVAAAFGPPLRPFTQRVPSL